MPDVPIPPFQDLLWPTLEALKAIGGSGTIHEIDAKVIELVGFSEDQQGVLHGNGPQSEISYRLAWCRTYLKAVGALENSARAVWSLTDVGRQLTPGDMDAIPAQVRAMHPRGPRPRRRRRGQAIEPVDEATLVESDSWKDQLLNRLLEMPPDRFERLCQRLLREAGFTSVEVRGRSGDGGIDGVGILRLTLLSFPVFFQSKRYRGSVGPGIIRDFRGAMAGRGDKGLLITTGTFTREAELEARRDGVPPIDLIDGDRLCELLKQYELGVQAQRVETVTIEPSWYEDI